MPARGGGRRRGRVRRGSRGGRLAGLRGGAGPGEQCGGGRRRNDRSCREEEDRWRSWPQPWPGRVVRTGCPDLRAAALARRSHALPPLGLRTSERDAGEHQETADDHERHGPRRGGVIGEGHGDRRRRGLLAVCWPAAATTRRRQVATTCSPVRRWRFRWKPTDRIRPATGRLASPSVCSTCSDFLSSESPVTVLWAVLPTQAVDVVRAACGEQEVALTLDLDGHRSALRRCGASGR